MVNWDEHKNTQTERWRKEKKREKEKRRKEEEREEERKRERERERREKRRAKARVGRSQGIGGCDWQIDYSIQYDTIHNRQIATIGTNKDRNVNR